MLEAQARGKVVGTHQEASWPKAVARGGTHSSVDQGGRPTGGPQHRPPVLSNRFQATSLKRFGVLRLLQLDRDDPFAPPYKYERGVQQIGFPKEPDFLYRRDSPWISSYHI